jgi:signal transduction histidine kinase
MFTIVIILAASSLLSAFVITNVLPTSSAVFAMINAEIDVNAMRIFRVYFQLSIVFAFALSAVVITITVNKTLKPIIALTEGTKKVAGGDFGVVIPVDINRHDELRDLTDSFNKMARELSLITMLNNDFINNVSHEFKTPISSIQGFAAVLLSTDLTDEQKEYAEIIAFESARLTKLAENILKLTKLENQVIITEKEDFYIDEQIRYSYVLLQSELFEKNIDICFELSPIKYNGNPGLIQQIWHNLLSNAVKFSNENGRIKINCEKKDGNAVISITDNGIGMNETTVAHIFDKFYQGDLSHAKQGNGLGLSIVKRIAELCGGTIDIKSTIGKGSEFIVRLPL